MFEKFKVGLPDVRTDLFRGFDIKLLKKFNHFLVSRLKEPIHWSY